MAKQAKKPQTIGETFAETCPQANSLSKLFTAALSLMLVSLSAIVYFNLSASGLARATILGLVLYIVAWIVFVPSLICVLTIFFPAILEFSRGCRSEIPILDKSIGKEDKCAMAKKHNLKTIRWVMRIVVVSSLMVSVLMVWVLIGSVFGRPVLAHDFIGVVVKKDVKVSHQLSVIRTTNGYSYSMRLGINNEGAKVAQNITYAETISKEFAQTTGDIEFSKKPKILSEDPIVSWHFASIKPGEEIVVNYVSKIVKTDINEQEFQKLVDFYDEVVSQQKDAGGDASQVVTISVEPGTATVNVAAATALSAFGITLDGKRVALKKVSWKTSNPHIATISPNGVVVGVAPGVTIITAETDSISGQSDVNVVNTGGISTSPQTVINTVGGSSGQSGTPSASSSGGSAPYTSPSPSPAPSPTPTPAAQPQPYEVKMYSNWRSGGDTSWWHANVVSQSFIATVPYLHSAAVLGGGNGGRGFSLMVYGNEAQTAWVADKHLNWTDNSVNVATWDPAVALTVGKTYWLQVLPDGGQYHDIYYGKFNDYSGGYAYFNWSAQPSYDIVGEIVGIEFR